MSVWLQNPEWLWLLSAVPAAVAAPMLGKSLAGLGRSVAFTSRMWPRWGRSWLEWEQFSPLWSRAMR